MAVLLLTGAGTAASAQPPELFVGALAGVSTLSGDSRTVTAPSDARVSVYTPQNGPVLNVVGGMHLARFFSVQGNYVWNRNDVTLLSSSLARMGGGFYEQERAGGQHAAIADALLYFRAHGDRIRPYLSAGAGVTRFRSARARRTVESGLAAPEGEIARTRVGLRVAVGIDVALGGGWDFRYSFSETISGNPISPHLTPPGGRNLANFDNLFGVVRRFSRRQ